MSNPATRLHETRGTAEPPEFPGRFIDQQTGKILKIDTDTDTDTDDNDSDD